MELVKSLQQYQELIRWNKKRLGRIQKNGMFLSKVMEPYIRDGRLWVERYADGLAFYVDEGTYEKLYCFWSVEREVADFRRERPVIAEFLEMNPKEEVDPQSLEGKLLSSGFEPYRKNLQVERPIGKDFSQKILVPLNENYHMEYCRDEDLPQVFELWRTHLNITDIPLDHYQRGNGEKILCAYDAQGKVASTNWWKNAHGSSEGRHAVTHPDDYRKGLALALFAAWYNDALEEGMGRIRTWVNDANYRSLAMCEKMGFLPNGRVSKQYIIR